jgi:putative NADH-flavin reductase
MKMPRKRTILLVPLTLFALVYIGAAVMLALRDNPIAALDTPAGHKTIAIFGASGTAGDGILKAALASPDIQKIHVITRRTTPRIEQGVASGKVQMTLHKDYLDYAAIEDQLRAADAVFWAIGLSSFGVDEKTYGTIHVDYPAAFVTKWLSVSERPSISFHYISSSDISDDSTAMWAREKVRAEKTLFKLAAGTKLRVIAYRPDYIGPTDEEAHLGQIILYGFFAPIGAAVKAEQIGKAMIEVTARSENMANGDKLGTRSIIRHADAYDRRVHIPGTGVAY